MKTRIALSICMAFSAILLLSNFRLFREVSHLREEQTQGHLPIAPVIVGTQGSDVPETSRKNEQSRKDHDELIRLRNRYGLLRNEVNELETQNRELRRKAEESETEIETERSQKRLTVSERRQMQKEAITSLEEQLNEWTQQSIGAKRRIIALAELTNMPDAIAQMEASAGIKNPKLQEYWPYFEAQRELDNCLRVIDAIRLKIETEKAELRSTTNEN